jgi:GNAT superfamily N-acetyltransferase
VDAISIRPAQDADATALAELSGQLGYPLDAAAMRVRLQRVREAGNGEVFVAVTTAGAVVGWTHVVKREQLEDAPFAELSGLIVDASARNAGLGALLLQSAERWASDNGLARLRVRSNVVRERAHRFYLRAGYAERKRQVVFEKVL